MTSFQTFSSHPDQVGESPIWDSQGSCLWWVDIESQRIHQQSLNGARQSWHLPEKTAASALGRDMWHAGERLQAVADPKRWDTRTAIEAATADDIVKVRACLKAVSKRQKPQNCNLLLNHFKPL